MVFRNPSSIKNSDDRVISLKAKKGVKNVHGLSDPRLFTGENKMHAIMDPMTRLWAVKYETGAPPSPIRYQKFTSLPKLYKFVEAYFNTRNIEIKEVHNA